MSVKTLGLMLASLNLGLALSIGFLVQSGLIQWRGSVHVGLTGLTMFLDGFVFGLIVRSYLAS